MERVQMWIDGAPSPAAGGGYFPSINPSDGEVWCEVAAGGAADVDRAVASALAAFEGGWRSEDPIARRARMQAIAAVIRQHRNALADIESRDSGKLLREARLHVSAAAEWFDYFAGMTDKNCGQTIPSEGGVFSFTRMEPYGVVGAIVPGNSPLLLTSWKLAPALAAGNTLVVKPSEYTSASLIRLMTLIGDILPPGVVNVVTGLGAEAGVRLVENPDVRKVAFTGGSVHGAAVAASAGRRIAPSLLELGGKSANIVFEDAVFDKALAGAMAGVFAATGQTCMAGSRLLVQAGLYERLVSELRQRIPSIRVGHAAHSSSQVGPLGTKAQFDRVSALVAAAREGGASVLAGAQAASVDGFPGGYYYQPTLLAGVTNESPICRQEIFGPVMTVMSFETEDEALAIANDSAFGLVAGLWTSDLFRAHTLAERLNVGTVFLNLYRKVSPQVPFGGFRASGFGRENGFEVMREYSQVKSVVMDVDRDRIQDPFTMDISGDD